MEPYNIIRILIVVTSGISIFLGYKLFYLVTERQGNLLIKYDKNYSISLSDVGPGVFFALFGTACIISILLTQPKIEIIQRTIEGENGTVATEDVERKPANIAEEMVSVDFENLNINSSISDYYSKILEDMKTAGNSYENEKYKTIDDIKIKALIDEVTNSNKLKHWCPVKTCKNACNQ